MIGLLHAVRTLRALRRAPGRLANALRLVQQALAQQQHAAVRLVHARLVQLGELLGQPQRFVDVRFGAHQIVELEWKDGEGMMGR